MKLIELNNICDEVSWDTGDSVYDAIVHIELDKTQLPPNPKWMDKFTEAAYSKIEIEKIFNGAYANAICHYHKLFEDNIKLWRQYTKKHWSKEYHDLYDEDEDEYIYQLIQSLHEWFNGYKSEDGYKELYEIIIKCKEN